MDLSESERETILSQLREEALRDCRAQGCTCEPRMSLTEKTYGPHDLPMWATEHDDDCGLTIKMRDIDGAIGRRLDDGGSALMIGESIRRRFREGR